MDKLLNYRNFLKSKNIKKKNKTAVITGGCGRVGSIFTSQLLYDNYEVICLSKTNTKYLDFKKNLPIKLKKKLHWQSIDLVNPHTVNQAVDYIFKKFSKLDVLINNAAEFNRGKNLIMIFNPLVKNFGVLW